MNRQQLTNTKHTKITLIAHNENMNENLRNNQ